MNPSLYSSVRGAATAEKDTEKEEQSEGQPSSRSPDNEPPSTSGSSPQQGEGELDLGAQLKKLRSDKPPVQTSGGIQGILEETLLIEWPKPLQAIKDTVLVISILAGTTVFLFVANSIFAELSAKYLRH
ncbi:hypothetical protein WJX73_005627 [Symbiochloris irregularis]|uniref:Preprotein translocase subunit SecE n=1 Tax=Symbiochloris irregularis TaxID=706552 RepID=A0AAW1PQJ0_9CHLO